MTEIIEEGIARLTIHRRGPWDRHFIPAGGRAKWFRDELGQLWCKFDLAPNTGQQNVVQIVVPASRVLEVQYRK